MINSNMKLTEPFRFKQFVVNQDQVTMKVGTDGVLVGSWADITDVQTVLDIGTGSGLIALMMAQRIGVGGEIHAIDVDDIAIKQALENFNSSPWPGVFSVHHQSIQEFSKSFRKKFDLIISNPPFFTGGMLSEHNLRNDVRHTTKLPHGDLLLAVDRLLNEKGKLTLILPYLQGLRFMEISQTYRLFPHRITEVFGRQGKSVERMLIDFTRTPLDKVKNELYIHRDSDDFTEEYSKLTSDFYLKF